MSHSPQNAPGYGEMPFSNQLQTCSRFIACLDLAFQADYTQDCNFSDLQAAVLGRSNGVNGMNLESSKASLQLRMALADAYRQQVLSSTKPTNF